MHTRSCGLLFVLLLLPTLAAAQSKHSADEKELAQYRLTMDAVNKVAVATRAMAAEMKTDPRFQEVMKIEAEIKALESKDERTEAEDQRLEALNARKEKIEESFGAALSMNEAASLSDMAAQIQKFPPLANGLRKAGMTPREYATFMMAMVQASLVAGFQKAGLAKEIPKEVNPENVKFVQDHEKELQALQKELQALGSGGA